MTTFTLIVTIVFVAILVWLFMESVEHECYSLMGLFGFMIAAFAWIVTHI